MAPAFPSKANPKQWTWVGTFNLLLMLKAVSWEATDLLVCSDKERRERNWRLSKPKLHDLWNGTFSLVYLGGLRIWFQHIRMEADSWCRQKSAAHKNNSKVSERLDAPPSALTERCHWGLPELRYCVCFLFGRCEPQVFSAVSSLCPK